MIRKLIGSMCVMALCIGLISAEEFRGNIKKVEGKNVTFSKFQFKKVEKDKKDEKKAEDTTLPLAKGAKITKGTRDFKEKKTEVGEAIEGGLKNEMFTKIDEKKGLFVEIRTNDDNTAITHIIVLPAFEFKKKKTDK